MASDCITPKGFKTLQDELSQLWEVERPKVVRTVHWAAGNGDRSENGDYIYGKKRLRQIDGRLRFLRKRLESLTVADPRDQKNQSQIFFGATVEYERGNCDLKSNTIVGKDETDPALGLISIDSPIGRSLLKKSVGDLVVVHTPAGEEELDIVRISYPPKDSDQR
ncbi:MAG: transcription elongation factor GreB [Magnetovibrio sp.]|nr:transcription elongation factor GreB [Magnetovibrio sp.]